MADYDLAIIGGGLNGVSMARDAAGRGLRVILLEQGDLGGAASSASPRLVHGDLGLLERREFFRVRTALAERDIWFRIAPHLVRPMRFVIPTSVRPGCCGLGYCSTTGWPRAPNCRRRRRSMSPIIRSATR
jgi:glycerol-3-phosphate dehydrogenase